MDAKNKVWFKKAGYMCLCALVGACLAVAYHGDGAHLVEATVETLGLKVEDAQEVCCVDGETPDPCCLPGGECEQASKIRVALDDGHGHDHDDGHGHDHDDGEAPETMDGDGGGGGMITISAAAQENLGIRFATVERRTIEKQLRIPGTFAFLPGARQEYRSLLPGRITLHVEVFGSVAAGDLLFSIDSMAWRTMQHEAVEAEGEVKMAEAALRVAQARRVETQSTLRTIEERITALAQVNVRRAELEARQVELRSGLPRHDAEIALAQEALEEAREHYQSRLGILAAATGLSVAGLKDSSEGAPSWRKMNALEVVAKRDGIVESIVTNNGGWLENGELALTVADPEGVWFHGKAPQAELPRLRDGLGARIVPPQGSIYPVAQQMAGELQVGLTGHAQDRTIDVFMRPELVQDWARPGVSAHLEVIEDAAAGVLVVPQSALVQDGVDTVLYRRDDAFPDILHRVVADLGIQMGDWAEVQSGLEEGDEVVAAGAYALKVAGGESSVPEGYHVHADGSLHKDH